MKDWTARPRLVLLTCLLLPTLVLAGWALSIAGVRAGHPAMRVDIQGYDPRDLLRGHYLQARLKLELPAGPAPECVCLEAGAAAGDPPAIRPLASCQPLELGACRYPLAAPSQILRIYVPQAKAASLDRKLSEGEQRLSVNVHFAGDGTVGISDLMVDGVPVADLPVTDLNEEE